MRLLSTKNVSKSFKDELNQSGISLKEHPMIQIVPIQFKISKVNSALMNLRLLNAQGLFNRLTTTC